MWICNAALCVICHEKWAISDDQLKICIDCYSSKPSSMNKENTAEKNTTKAVDFIYIADEL